MISQAEMKKINRTLIKKTIREVKERQMNEREDWYFVGMILTFPQTMVIEQQIQQAIYVFESENPEEVIVVVLSQPAVRKYCNFLKPFSKIEVVNAERKYSYLNNIYVLITERSTVYLVEEASTDNQGFRKMLEKKQAEFEQPKMYVSLNISNIGAKTNQSNPSQSSEEESELDQRTSKSQQIVLKKQGLKEELVNICGIILTFYDVGRGKMNHGIGYRIEQCFSGLISEVVIWSDTGCGPLKKGKQYHFKQFRIHRKGNLQTSYHSHPLYSSVSPLA